MAHPESVGMSSERLTLLDSVVNKYVGEDKLAGITTLIARRGEVVHFKSYGLRDREQHLSMTNDTIVRIYSMTKPIICTALMMLYEKAEFQLNHPVAEYIPAFADLNVFAGLEGEGMKLEDLHRPVTIKDLLTHTSGLSYHLLEYGPVEQYYRDDNLSAHQTLEEFVHDLLQFPLAFQPGTQWRYSFAHDVVARLIEILSGQPIDVFLQENLFDPLNMVDTGYYVTGENKERLAAMYGSMDASAPKATFSNWVAKALDGKICKLESTEKGLASQPHQVFRGGHGLVSTAQDYFHFCQMLLEQGEWQGKRFLSRKTIEMMTTNQLAPELLPFDIQGIVVKGYGYGLGMRTLMDVGQAEHLGSVGEYGWAGAANTYSWIDPNEDLIGILLSQFQPNGFHAVSADFRTMVYQAIVE